MLHGFGISFRMDELLSFFLSFFISFLRSKKKESKRIKMRQSKEINLFKSQMLFHNSGSVRLLDCFCSPCVPCDPVSPSY